MRAIHWLLMVVLICGCGSEQGSDAHRADRTAPSNNEPAARVVSMPAQRASRSPKPISAAAAPASKSTARPRAPRDAVATTCPLVQVSGRVAFEDGTPFTARISTATVELWRAANSEALNPTSEQRLDVSEIGENGRYVLAGSDAPNLRVEVIGISRAIADLNDPDDQTTEPRVRKLTQDFLIPAPQKITGRVIDAQDRPVTSATVSLRSEDVKTDGWYYGNQQTTVTAAGEFTLKGVAAGPGTIGAAAPGFGAITQDMSAPTSGPIILRLTTGTATVNGHVLLFPTDAPAAGAKVTISPAGKARTLGLAASTSVESRTAADGSFTFNHLGAGAHRFSVSAADGQELFAAPGKENQAAMAPTLHDNQTTAIALRVFSGYTVVGRVYDKDTSEPLAGAQATAYRGSTPMRRAITNADGHYKLERIGADWGSNVAVALEGYTISPQAQLSYANNATAAVRVAYPDNSDEVTVDVPMVPVVTLTGRVENKEGLPVADAHVHWGSANHSLPNDDANQITNALGIFRFLLPPFQGGLVEVKAAGYAFKRSDPIKIATQDISDMVVVVEAGGTVDGRVVNPAGEGVADAAIEMRDMYSIGYAQTMSMRPLGKSAADGTFHIDGLAVQENVRLQAKAKGFSPGLTVVHLEPGETKTGVEIKLAEELTIEGRVIDGKNKPVSAWLSGFGFDMTQTDAQGAFKLSGLSPSEVDIFVRPSDARPSKQVRAKVGTKDMIIQLDDQEEMRAHCKVVDGLSKRPIEKFDVTNIGTVAKEGEGPGGFSFALKPSEGMMPKVSAEGYVTRTFSVWAPKEKGDFEKILEMGVGSGVSGRVVDGAGKAVPDIPIAVYEETMSGWSGNSPSGNSISGEDGKFLVSKIPAGKVRVVAMPKPPAANATKQVELKDGEFQDVGDIAIGEAGSISGKVVSVPSGEPKAGVYVNINAMGDGEPFYKLIITGPDGLFRVDGLQPRIYRAEVNGHREQAEVQSGETNEITIELGTTSVSGIVWRAGAPATAVIKAKNLQTGKTVTSNTGDTGRYSLSEMTAGEYQITVVPTVKPQNQPANPADAPQPHTETLTVPDQSKLVKDFALP